ncbi:MAG: diguanylate cyclase, partial [Xanthomonadales bacterium]|nr:diguanylate cyclase [Xanthomonadales bacterium]
MLRRRHLLLQLAYGRLIPDVLIYCRCARTGSQAWTHFGEPCSSRRCMRANPQAHLSSGSAMSGLIVALCDLQPKDARLLDIVVKRAPSRRYDFKLVDSEQAGFADIAIIDADQPTAADNVKRLREDSPGMVEVYVSETGSAGEGDYRIARRSLILQCFRLLESIAKSKLEGNLANEQAPAVPAAARAAVEREAAATTGESVSALVVDDSATVRTQLEITLRRLGLAVEAVANGEEAMQLLRDRSFDLILLDVVMPDCDGYQTLEMIQSSPTAADIPVIFVTAMSELDDEEAGLNAGAVDYITKPISPAIVRARVRTHVELKRQRDALNRLAETDGLTGIANRRRFDRELDRMWRTCQRRNEAFCLMLADVDFFKLYNDHFGHGPGDHCLREVGQALARAAYRSEDVVARYGGEEFA